METVTIDEIEPRPYDEDLHADRRVLTDALGTSDVAIVRWVLEPGERFSGAVHAHADQEEVFVVLEGAATFETETVPGEGSDEIVVREGEAVRFAPGEFQSGGNEGDERLVAIALGAPRDTDDIRVSRIPALDDRDVSCPDCGRGAMRMTPAEEHDFVCPDCGGELTIE